MKGDFFYSPSTRLYVARKPLRIDARVKNAADKKNVKLEWDDEGRISSLNFDDSRHVLAALDSHMLTPTEYWKVYDDAKNLADKDMIAELTSAEYAEWLNRIYPDDIFFIDNPDIEGKYIYSGDKTVSKKPFGTPGWFNPENNINLLTGEPLQVELQRERFATSWKYWSPNLATTNLGITVPVRGYVTSVGKPSFDLGIPADSRQPKLMIRECRKTPLSTIIEESILTRARTVLTSKNPSELLEFLESYGKLFSSSHDVLIHTLREQFFDKLGDMMLENIDISKSRLSDVSSLQMNYDSFRNFIINSGHSLKRALEEKKDIIFVMGHKNPDTDSVIGAMFEAWRNHILEDNSTYVPVVQSHRIPDEVKELLGELSSHVLLTSNPLYEKIKTTGLARWISVDQNREPEVQKYFVSIIDHHIVSDVAKKQVLPKTFEMLGSSAALVTRKYLGMGIQIDKNIARILYGATLMDTENRVEHKMTPQDVKIMDYLKAASGCQEDDGIMYKHLMSFLLNTDDSELLFRRDYKEDWGFGFGVAKIKNGFSKDGSILKQSLIERLQNLSVQNTSQKNLPLTLLKITDYDKDNETVNRERVFVAFNKDATPVFRKVIMSALESIIKFEFPKDALDIHEDYIEFYGTGMQLSRKKTAPVIEPIVAAFNQYFYSSSIGKWVKRDFLKYTQYVKNANSNLSTDSYDRINYLTYIEAKKLCNALSIDMLSLPEYWNVLNDAKKLNDIQMLNSLQGSNFVEFLDSAIIDKEYLIEHPEVEAGTLKGTRRKVYVPVGSPKLIHPNDIDFSTGIPSRVREPNEYGNPALWRYWSPDASIVIPCRSYIFLLGQPCWDGKFHMTDSLPNLGLRPVAEKVENPQVSFSWDTLFLTVKINVEKEDHEYRWPKDIKQYAHLSD